MARPRKDYIPISFKLDKGIYNELTKYCEESGQTKTIAMERALKMYIESSISQKPAR